MIWQHHILTWLSLQKSLPEIVTDETGVLSVSEFGRFLVQEGIPFLVAQDEPALFRATRQSDVRLIITNLEAPFFLKSKVVHKTFSHQHLPLNGETYLLKSLGGEVIARLLDYCFQTDQHVVISRQTLPALLEKSEACTREGLLQELQTKLESLVTSTVAPESVLQAGKLWGEVQLMSFQSGSSDFLKIIPKLDGFAQQFLAGGGMEKAFIASTNSRPLTVDRILGNISANKAEKAALICFDCMGMAEWELLKAWLTPLSLHFDESVVFAMLPTVTAISRSAIFSGNREVHHLKYPGRKKEEIDFAAFFNQHSTRYFTENDLINHDTLLGYDIVSVLYTFFDDLAHAAQFPPGEQTKHLYFKSVLNWLDHSSLRSDLQTLLQNGFSLYFCSDHGSTVATGNGRKLEKYIQEKFAKRGCMIAAENQELTDIRHIPIPFQNDKIIVIPEGRQMFANGGVVEINHGGISLDEMVVPFIKVRQT